MSNVDRACDLGILSNLELPSTCVVAERGECALPAGAAETTLEALASPIGYPPLADAVTEDDRVVVAVARPRAPVLAAAIAVLDHLAAEGRSPEHMQLLCGWKPRSSDESWIAALPRGVAVARRATKRDDFAFLAGADDGRPIYLQRTLLDADVVIPVGAAGGDAFAAYGVLSVLFPTFSSPAARRRHLDPRVARSAALRRRLGEELKSVHWLSGASFAVQALCGPEDQLRGVAAGDSHQVEGVCREWIHRSAAAVAEERFPCVVSIAAERQDEHPWESIAQAAVRAASVVEPDGAIVIAAEHCPRVPRAVAALAAGREEDTPVGRLPHCRSSVVAARLDAAARQARLFLLSPGADLAAAEDAGFVPLDSADDLTRLLSRFDRSWLLPASVEAATTES